MFEEGENSEEELNREIEEMISRVESLSLTPAPMLRLVVSEQDINTEKSLKGRRRGFNMDFRVRRGHGG